MCFLGDLFLLDKLCDSLHFMLLYFVFVKFYYDPLESLSSLLQDRKVVVLTGRGYRLELEEMDWKTIRINCMRKEFMFNKKRKSP